MSLSRRTSSLVSLSVYVLLPTTSSAMTNLIDVLSGESLSVTPRLKRAIVATILPIVFSFSLKILPLMSSCPTIFHLLPPLRHLLLIPLTFSYHTPLFVPRSPFHNIHPLLRLLLHPMPPYLLLLVQPLQKHLKKHLSRHLKKHPPCLL